ncbi:stage VI sporulation protein D [Saccharococcus thermophilus]|uniref:Stage VI sporulation protein D n=1 Tax=Saccharococcus thermophilus TaxID=29396 RepID=A0A846MJ23_9BACL|nr:stage VI sporulation protein D [Saccharococcus thermophilus]NIK15623.1 stage VI sporulation protein D [Saccharococcus thermophilus]
MEQSYLRFSLEESVWFKKGQEVAEFLSISLDPVVSVDEYEQYITIRGALQLNGEFRLAEGEVNDTDIDTDSFDFVSHRFIQRVSTREDGISELSHRFPIDITIPKNRIHHLEDVYVTVESFDYDLDEDGRLLVTADISISGISEAPLHEEFSAIEEEDDELLFEPFEVIARKEAYEEEQQEQRDEQAEETVSPIIDNVFAQSDEEQEETAADRKEKKEKKLAENVVPLERDEQMIERQEVAPSPANNEANEEKEEAIADRKEKKEKKLVENVVPLEHDEKTIKKQETAASSADNEPVKAVEENEEAEEKTAVLQQEAKVSIGAVKENDEDETKEEEKPKVKSENALYLTKLFAKNQVEEFTKVKICIVQQGDSLDKIAERYDLTVQQLLRVNELESAEDIHEGQLLYIPALAGSRSS